MAQQTYNLNLVGRPGNGGDGIRAIKVEYEYSSCKAEVEQADINICISQFFIVSPKLLWLFNNSTVWDETNTSTVIIILLYNVVHLILNPATS